MKTSQKYSSAQKVQSNFDKKLHVNTNTGKKSAFAAQNTGEVSHFTTMINLKNEKQKRTKNNHTNS